MRPRGADPEAQRRRQAGGHKGRPYGTKGSVSSCFRGTTKFRRMDRRNDSRRGSRSGASGSAVRSSPHPGEPDGGAPKGRRSRSATEATGGRPQGPPLRHEGLRVLVLSRHDQVSPNGSAKRLAPREPERSFGISRPVEPASGRAGRRCAQGAQIPKRSGGDRRAATRAAPTARRAPCPRAFAARPSFAEWIGETTRAAGAGAELRDQPSGRARIRASRTAVRPRGADPEAQLRRRIGAGNGGRTRDIHLGKVALYH